jgi:hypothetical protein
MHARAFVLFASALAAVAAWDRAAADTSDPERRSNPAGAGGEAERQAVAATVQLYFQGHATGSGEFFRKAMHPEGKMFWIKDGALAQRPFPEYIAGAPGKPADDEARRVRRILMIDVTGDAAVAKVELAYPDATLIDYLSLLRIDGRWMVINKIFHRSAPRPAVPSHR